MDVLIRTQITVLSAVLTGFVIRFFSSLLKDKIERILVK